MMGTIAGVLATSTEKRRFLCDVAVIVDRYRGLAGSPWRALWASI